MDRPLAPPPPEPRLVTTSPPPSRRLSPLVGFIVMGAILLIGGVTSTYLLIRRPSPTPEPLPPPTLPLLTLTPAPNAQNSTGWRTITNTTGHYAVEIPATWTEMEHSPNYPYDSVFQAADHSQLRITGTATTQPTLAAYLKEYDLVQQTSWEGQPGIMIETSKPATLAGLPVIRRTEQWLAAGFTATVTYIYKDGVVYSLAALPSGDGSPDTQTVVTLYDRVLQTFRFGGTTPSTTTPTTTINAAEVYWAGALGTQDKELLSHFTWPRLTPFKTGAATREVYLVNCEVTNDALGFRLTGVRETLPNVPNIAEVTLKKLLDKRYGGFPPDTGVNGLKLAADGTLGINFTAATAAYGGGSARVACMHLAARFTLMQFPTIKQVVMCIDQYPTPENQNCAMDFQP